MNRMSLVFVGLFVAVGFAGCSGEEQAPQVDVYPASGTVTLNGDIVADAAVLFIPQKGPTARGRTNEKGEFVLTSYTDKDGAVAGKHAVVVTKTEGGDDPVSEEGDTEESASADLLVDDVAEPKSFIPAEYTSAATTSVVFEVTTDGEKNKFSIELTGSVD